MVAARHTGQVVGYIRVSSADQNTARQLEGVQLDKKFEDTASGKDTNRPQLRAALNHLREGDRLVVHSMDRLARNLVDLKMLVEDLTARGVQVEFLKEGLNFTADRNSTADLMLSIMGAVAEFERAMIRERQREGIAQAKAAGVYKGRKPSLNAERVIQLKARIASGEKKVSLAREFGISRETLYQYTRVQPPSNHLPKRDD